MSSVWQYFNHFCNFQQRFPFYKLWNISPYPSKSALQPIWKLQAYNLVINLGHFIQIDVSNLYLCRMKWLSSKLSKEMLSFSSHQSSESKTKQMCTTTTTKKSEKNTSRETEV